MRGAPSRTPGSSIYPAVQNMLLAARALGLGATLTTLRLQFEKEGSCVRFTARRQFLRAAVDRLPNGPVRACPRYYAGRCRLRRPVGPALSTRSTLHRNGWRRILPASVIVVFDPEGAHSLSNSYRSRSSRVRSKDTCQSHEICVFVRSTGSLIFREKYSFLTLHPVRLLM